MDLKRKYMPPAVRLLSGIDDDMIDKARKEIYKNPSINKQMDKVNNKQILSGIKVPIELTDDQVLIKPLPEVKVMKEFTEYDEEANTNRNTDIDGEEASMKTITKEVTCNTRKGVILTIDKTGLNPLPYEAGDTIVYSKNAGRDFDLFKDSKILKRFEVLGKWIGE